MTYEQARNSGYPFNRKKYEDGWYVKGVNNTDRALQDLSQRFWSESDLAATDWRYITDVYNYEEPNIVEESK
jgi:hypothetical protein